MSRRPDLHPTWCAASHVCDADDARRAGAHRSYPQAIDTTNGQLVFTRIRTRGGREQVQVTAIVDLPQDQVEAMVATQKLTIRLCQAISPADTGATIRD